MKKRYLILENGTVFEGEAIGEDKCSVGELIFTTGMNGYIETLTDPSYCGQIVVQTFPMIGNYGFIPEDVEGKCMVSGYVVNDICSQPSNFRCESPLEEFLIANDVPGIKNVDTRELTKILRESGVMNAKLSDRVEPVTSEIISYRATDVIYKVTATECFTLGDGDKKVVLIDYGAKRNIIRELVKRGCSVTVFPCSVTSDEILKGGFDGVMLSNGPGDPADNVNQIAVIRELFGRVPMFGICLGHQMMALANGGLTRKMKYGHRGANQPVRETNGARAFITSQNHGYEVISRSVKRGKVSYINANDGTNEGIDYLDEYAFSVQFHPEAASGPKDTSFLFDRFIQMMEDYKKCR